MQTLSPEIAIVSPEAVGGKYVFADASDYVQAIRKHGARAIIGGATNAPQMPMIPFVGAAHEHTEVAPVIKQLLASGGAATTYEFNVPSYGYMRALWLDISAAGGANTEATYAGDAPFNAIQEVTLLDTNGAPIFGPLSGYNVFLSNLYGGYAYQQDPRSLGNYNAGATSGNFRWQCRIPLEISHHDATGCIGNQNAAAPYRMRLTVAAPATIYTKAPGTYPTLTITPVLEAWSLPNAVDALGRPQAQLPPNYGTVQYWSERVQTGVSEGQNTVQVLRVGNLIRNLIFIARKTNATGTREDAIWPLTPTLNWDARQLNNDMLQYRENVSYEPLESIPTQGRPAGVLAYTFNRTVQGRAGDEKPFLWLPTVEATRLELSGSFEKEGVVNILVNDVAPAEVNPSQRYALPNATGFHPTSENQNPNQP